MSAPTWSGPAVRELLRQAARWRVAGLLFRSPARARALALDRLADETNDPECRAAAAGATATGEGLYLAWLGPGGPLPPREVSYRPAQDPGRILAEISAYHEAFAYHASAEDPADHVAVAADFIAYLSLKEAFAAGAERPIEAEVTRDARERFVDQHLRPIVRGMARRLAHVAEEVDTAHFPAAVGLLARLAEVDPAAIDAEGDAAFPLPGLDDDNFECGGGCPLRPEEPA